MFKSQSLIGVVLPFFFFFGWCADLLQPYSTSFTGTRLNCCLTCAVTLPHAICIPLSQIHCYTIPLMGKGFAMCQPRPQTREGKSINLVLGQRKKKVCTSAYSSVKNGVICKVCMRGFLTVPCCFVSAAHAAGTGIPYCLPGHWPGSAGGGLLAP